MNARLVIGSRGSKLALTQAEWVKARLSQLNPAIEISVEIIKTSGDVKNEPLAVIGGKGVFTKELEDALLEHRIDIAVHSLKDLPTVVHVGLAIAAVCEREDPRDALVLNQAESLGGLRELPVGSRVATSSPRRMAQLKHLRPDVVTEDIRGNVDTRLRKLEEKQFDALILAAAGLRRLGLSHRIASTISPDEMLPAVGQGALGIETRADDDPTISIVSVLNHEPTRVACTAERSMLKALGGGCQLPIAGYAVCSNQQIRLDGLVASRDGKDVLRDHVVGNAREAAFLGKELGERLLGQGARKFLS